MKFTFEFPDKFNNLKVACLVCCFMFRTFNSPKAPSPQPPPLPCNTIARDAFSISQGGQGDQVMGSVSDTKRAFGEYFAGIPSTSFTFCRDTEFIMWIFPPFPPTQHPGYTFFSFHLFHFPPFVPLCAMYNWKSHPNSIEANLVVWELFSKTALLVFDFAHCHRALLFYVHLNYLAVENRLIWVINRNTLFIRVYPEGEWSILNATCYTGLLISSNYIPDLHNANVNLFFWIILFLSTL